MNRRFGERKERDEGTSGRARSGRESMNRHDFRVLANVHRCLMVEDVRAFLREFGDVRWRVGFEFRGRSRRDGLAERGHFDGA